MSLAVSWMASLASAEAPPTLASLKNLPPAAVGELVLKGREHGPIDAAGPARAGVFDPPGATTLALTERPVRLAGGCVRKKWSAHFQAQPGAEAGTGRLTYVYSVREILLVERSGCAAAEFVHVDPGLSVERALSALERLREIRTRKHEVRYSCSDATSSGLCRSPATIRQALRGLQAWAATREASDVELWHGTSGQVVTAVTFSSSNPDQVKVVRKIPAPF